MSATPAHGMPTAGVYGLLKKGWLDQLVAMMPAAGCVGCGGGEPVAHY